MLSNRFLMPASYSEEIVLTILISTILVFFFVLLIGYFFFQQQKKRFLYQSEVMELRESFNQTILQSKLEIQERTLDHIAKELHANFSHLVSLININLSAILAQSSGDIREHVNETKLLAKQLMQEVKTLSVSLNSDYIMKAGFVKAFENELARLTKTKRYKVNYQQTGVPIQMPSGEEIVLYRLCQEVLNNIVKHSQANKITVNLEYKSASLCLMICDNGIGFDQKKVATKSIELESTGLLNMSTRAKLINADFVVSSNLNEGTTVILTVPFKNRQHYINEL